MVTAKVTSKGQITIPRSIRERLGLRPGERISFEEKDGVFFIRRSIQESILDKWVGTLKKQKGKSADKILEELRGR